eukprot:Nk52_evm9s2192 gene=Nk52_evmTU9s2192
MDASYDIHKACESVKPQTIVIKIGSSSIVDANTKQVALSTLTLLVETICAMMEKGHKVLLVSSGAVGIGTLATKVDPDKRTTSMKRALAGVGQGRLMRVYDDLFQYYNKNIGQVLITRGDLNKRKHYKRARETINQFLELGVVPIINENDTLSNEDTNFQDNDTISAFVSAMVEADWLFLMTDVDALYTSNPATNPDAKPIHYVESIADLQDKVQISGSGSSWGTGGMTTKVNAARLAIASGCRTAITSSSNPNSILKILNGEKLGTVFERNANTLNEDGVWISHCLAPEGSIVVDTPCAEKIVDEEAESSVPVMDVVQVDGDFQSDTAIKVLDTDGQELARGLSNISSSDLKRALRKPSTVSMDGESSDSSSTCSELPHYDKFVIDDKNLAVLIE